MTAQFHEKLILEGKETSMAFCPPLPDNHPRLVMLSNEQLVQFIQEGAIHSFVFSTACWRQYIGTWELKDGKFYLIDIQGRYHLVGSEPLLEDWFTGVLRIPDGNLLHYVHMGFGSVYEFETHIKIVAGEVVEERRIDNRKKDVNPWELGSKNFPGQENKFDGDNL